MPDRLYFTDSDEANALIATDPMALLIGFALDQQVTVQKAFMGPLVLRERLGAIDAATLATADLEPVFRERPAIHRYPGNMARRVHDLAVYVRDRYDGDAARVWTDAADGDQLRANVAGLPGFGEMKIKSLGSVAASRAASNVPTRSRITSGPSNAFCTVTCWSRANPISSASGSLTRSRLATSESVKYRRSTTS